MSSPLADIDTNPQQASFKLNKDGSRIPGPPKRPRGGSSDRRSPFSVNATGSPCYAAIPLTSRTVISPAPVSRLPRKSTPTQSAFSKSYTYGDKSMVPRAGVSSAHSGQNLIAVSTPPDSDTTTASPAVSCNKALPSPPIVQIVDPASPPKAHRTLVDAEAGSPTSDEWPVLHPENITPSKPSTLLRDTALPQRSVSDSSVLERPVIQAHQSDSIAPALVEGRVPSPVSSLPAEGDDANHNPCKPTMESHTVKSEDPYSKIFHAFSTDTEAAMDNSIVEEQETLPITIIPPRTSSKRNSLPPPDLATGELPTRSLSASLRPIRPGSTKWPILGVASDHTTTGHTNDEQVTDDQQQLTVESRDDGPVSLDNTKSEGSHPGSIDSTSTWSLAAGSSLNDDPEVYYEGNVKVKRISWHSCNSGTGPTLRICADADAVLLGQDNSVPAVPAIPDRVPRNLTRSLASVIERAPSKIHLKMASSVSSRTPTSSSTTDVLESNPVKILPIRSMQPPRTPSTGKLPRTSAPAGTLTSTGNLQRYEQPRSSKDRSASSLEDPGDTSAAQFKSEDVSPLPKAGSEVSYDYAQSPAPSQDKLPSKAQKLLGPEAQAYLSTSRRYRPLTMMTPKSANSTSENSSIIVRSKTNPLLSTIEHDDRSSLSSSGSQSSALFNASRCTAPQASVHQLDATRPAVTAPEAQESRYACYENGDNQTVEQSIETPSLRVKAKRSFRNIFYRRRSTKKSLLDEKQESKRSSIAGSVLAQRMMKSANFSKVSIVRQPEVRFESKEDLTTIAKNAGVSERDTERQAALSALESVPTEVPPSSRLTHQFDTATLIHKILDHVLSMREESPDRLRGVEIAEAVLHAAECSKAAKMSAELARRHATDAELNARRVCVDLKRLEKLCEPGFDNETMQAIQQLISATISTEVHDEKHEPLQH